MNNFHPYLKKHNQSIFLILLAIVSFSDTFRHLALIVMISLTTYKINDELIVKKKLGELTFKYVLKRHLLPLSLAISFAVVLYLVIVKYEII